MNSLGTDTTYSYGPENRRYSKNVNGAISSYAYNGGEVIAEYSGFGSSASLLRRYVYGSGTDELIARIEYSGTTETSRVFYHADHQGSIIAEVSSSGTQIETFAYSPFGESLGGIPENEPTGNPYRYTGRRFDMETGLYRVISVFMRFDFQTA